MRLPAINPHPKGESKKNNSSSHYIGENQSLAVDTFGGKIHIEWDPHAAVTPLGQLAFFIEFLKLGNLFDSWVEDCPLKFISPNAPTKREILGTILLSVLSGHTRYAHITGLRGDQVNARLLGIEKFVSEDSLRRSFLQIEEKEGIEWLQKHLKKCYEPLLTEPWILDLDATVKTLYGKQEGAVVGYNPKKPGRPAHIYHAYFIANLRLVLEVEVQPGNQAVGKYSMSGLWHLLENMPRNQWPKFLRGDCSYGTDAIMKTAEEKGLPYLFKLKSTANVKRLIERLIKQGDWEFAGGGYEGCEAQLKLMGWEKERRVIILRKRIPKDLVSISEKNGQLEIGFAETKSQSYVYEYAVHVTTLTDEITTIAQHYRDRADSENIFDELKNQWGWGGFTTQDLKRCQYMSRIVGLIYNWWNLFVRLADPTKHKEAITSRPLLLHAVGKQISHAGQTRISISSTHGKIKEVKKLLTRIAEFFSYLKKYAEQLKPEERWYIILSKSLEKYLGGRILKPPIYLTATS